ncbi:MAG: hypothetical protein WBC53_08610 [Phycisphaerae bacterium]
MVNAGDAAAIIVDQSLPDVAAVLDAVFARFGSDNLIVRVGRDGVVWLCRADALPWDAAEG